MIDPNYCPDPYAVDYCLLLGCPAVWEVLFAVGVVTLCLGLCIWGAYWYDSG